MKKNEPNFTLAACVQADRWNQDQLSKWRHYNYSLIYDFGFVSDAVLCSHYFVQMREARLSGHGFCLRIMVDDRTVLDRLIAAADNVSFKTETLILAQPGSLSKKALSSAKKIAEHVFVEVYTEDMAMQAKKFKADGLVIRGNEAGGICSTMSNPILLRKIRSKISLPIWMFGGIGAQSALAYVIGGADGVILSDSLSLIPGVVGERKHSDINELRSGVYTQAVDIGNGLHIRISKSRPDLIHQVKKICVEHDRLLFEKKKHQDTRLSDVLSLMTRYRHAKQCFVGEELAWALSFSHRFDTVQDVMRNLEREILDQLVVLKKDFPLSARNALAAELKSDYPILQAPMTNVSDCTDFLSDVARNGAVPFTVLDLSGRENSDLVLRETRRKVNGKSWGVGLMESAPKEMQEKQIKIIEKYKPDVAIITGDWSTHYQTLRNMGVIPFIRVPVASMINDLFNAGVRHFLFEGRGCGGVIGPINSSVLWQSAIITLQQLAEAGEDLDDVRIAFAGGIFDALSAAMTSAFCAPLLRFGAKFGLAVGTSYLFTEEILKTEAITSAFQQVALDSENTVIIETHAGHAMRCAQTPAAFLFNREKAKLYGSDDGRIEKVLEKL